MNNITKDIPATINKRDTSNACVILMLAAFTFLCDRWTEATTDDPTPKSSPYPCCHHKNQGDDIDGGQRVASHATPHEYTVGNRDTRHTNHSQ